MSAKKYYMPMEGPDKLLSFYFWFTWLNPFISWVNDHFPMIRPRTALFFYIVSITFSVSPPAHTKCTDSHIKKKKNLSAECAATQAQPLHFF